MDAAGSPVEHRFTHRGQCCASAWATSAWESVRTKAEASCSNTSVRAHGLPRVQQGDLFLDGETPRERHAHVVGLDRRAFAHRNIASNADQTTELAEAATQLARLPGPLAGSSSTACTPGALKCGILPSRLTS